MKKRGVFRVRGPTGGPASANNAGMLALSSGLGYRLEEEAVSHSTGHTVITLNCLLTGMVERDMETGILVLTYYLQLSDWWQVTEIQIPQLLE